VLLEVRALITTTKGSPSNRVLSALTSEDLNLLTPALQQVDLPLRMQLEARNRRIGYVYFLDRGIASVVANGPGHAGIEIGIIGCEGLTGLAVLMGVDRSPHETYMQVAGAGHRISSSQLRDLMSQSASLHRALLRHAYAFTLQTAQTALVNGRHKIEERLARWLLMAHDRLPSDHLPLTHEFLALMLGVRRPGVTVEIKDLQERGLIRAQRRGILVIDRAGLEACANGAYVSAEEGRR
jgi:CRP-like cAMP-binding protein